MSTLITVISNCGSGKTALTRKLSEHFGLAPVLDSEFSIPTGDMLAHFGTAIM